jgi:hypothetical protein
MRDDNLRLRDDDGYETKIFTMQLLISVKFGAIKILITGAIFSDTCHK